jgi:hypothetical protein
MIANSTKRRFSLGAALAAIGSASIGCGPTNPETLVEDPGPLSQTFAVSDHFTPSGFMGDGEYMGKLIMDVNNEYCKERPPGAQGYCYRFTYWEGPKDWAGVFWVHPANNWGTRPGRAIVGRNFKQVRFKIATNYDPCSAQIENVTAKAEYAILHPEDTFFNNFTPPNPWYLSVVLFAGGISGINQDCHMAGYPYVDCTPPDPVTGNREPYKTTWNADTTTGWTEVHLNISSTPTIESPPNGWPTDYDYILGAFGWAVEYPAQPGASAGDLGPGQRQGSWRGSGMPLEIYVDDIVWDTEPVPADNDDRLLSVIEAPKCPAAFPPADAGAAGAGGAGGAGGTGGAGGAGGVEAGSPDAGTNDATTD